ncbi:MAG: glutamine amidotransferase [Vicinamibacteraceae bacterium]
MALALVVTWLGTAGLAAGRRVLLTGLRAATWALLVFALLRPIALAPPTHATDALVAIVVDASRSMQLTDSGADTRFAAARQTAASVARTLESSFAVETLALGDTLAPFGDRTSPNGRRSDLGAAIAAVRDRHAGRPLAAVVLVSDGVDTSAGPAAGARLPPVFTMAAGATEPPPDREVLAVEVGDAVLTDSVVELSATISARGFRGEPVELRVVENGRAVHVRRVGPPADGTALTERFRVSPSLDGPSVYDVEIASAPGELTTANNRQSVLVRPPGRARQVLLVEGAPGYEHSFIKRAWQLDRGLEIDALVRKGRDDKGRETYYVQAPRGRADSLVSGFPSTREALFRYDAIALANVGADLLGPTELELVRDFVAERGGGLLMLGARTLAPAGLSATPLEELMPVAATDRLGRSAPSSASSLAQGGVGLTPDGLHHPVMQLGTTPAEARDLWAAVPPLGSTTALGPGRPGASVLAVTSGAGGAPRPLVAVQRYGYGRTMVFAGEASWRWRMRLPSSDHTFETFWRQAGRWLVASAPEPVALSVPAVSVGETATLSVDVRDAGFRPLPDATVRLRVTRAGATQDLQATPDATRPGRFTAPVPADQPGLLRVDVEARRDGAPVGEAHEWTLVGGVDREWADPRRNDGVLDRLARGTGGRLIAEREIGELPALVAAAHAAAAALAPPEARELWHSPWLLLGLLAALGGEWILRRRWGLR